MVTEKGYKQVVRSRDPGHDDKNKEGSLDMEKRCPYDHRERLQTGSTLAVIQGMTIKTRKSRHRKRCPYDYSKGYIQVVRSQ